MALLHTRHQPASEQNDTFVLHQLKSLHIQETPKPAVDRNKNKNSLFGPLATTALGYWLLCFFSAMKEKKNSCDTSLANRVTAQWPAGSVAHTNMLADIECKC